MKRIFCDRCNREIEHHSVPVTINLSGGVNNIELDLCSNCISQLKNFLEPIDKVV
jgi:hypothetical protein